MIELSREIWFRRVRIPRLKTWNLRGVNLAIDGLSREMKSVIIGGQYEAAESWLCDKLLGPGDRVLELGSALGFIGLHCLVNRHVDAVVCVEANPATAARLRRSYELNLREPHVIEAAVSSSDAPVSFAVSESFWTDSVAKAGSDRPSVSVPGKTFETIYLESGGNANALVVDVEGAERFIDWSQVPSGVKKIIIELHPSDTGFELSCGILESLRAQGFRMRAYLGDVFGLERDLTDCV